DLPAEPLAGPTSADRYGILGEIARGGMGAIVKLVDNDIRRPVAMKVILGGDVKERVERFVEEAQVTGQLEHPNIVPVHELGLDPDGKVYFTMKLVKGESLDAIIDAIADKDPEVLRKYPLSHLLQIFLKVCDAIAFAHSKGVIHRDLKPENVMVGRFGEVLVMDWGLSKVKGREDIAVEDLVETIRSEREVGKTLSGEVMGTPSYMPPEQASGKVERIDERSDVFALGAMLYKILTHEAPYAGSNVTEVLRKAVTCAYRAPRVKSPWNRIPKELQSICIKAMSGRMADRYGSVEAMVEDIRAYLDHRPVSAHRSGLLTRFLRFVQRHPAGSLTGGVALVLVTLGGALTGVLLQRAEAERARAREKEALAEAEGSRAEAASVRAQLAEEAKAKAEVRATDAEDALKKGRLVSAVLRSANVELGEVLKELKRSFYSPKSKEERREYGDRFQARIEGFERNVPQDPASQAAWLAAKGWLLEVSRRPVEASALYERSREADSDVPYGYLFDAMARLAAYLEGQPLPVPRDTPMGFEFGGVPGETERMKSLRESFEVKIEKARKATVWGEESAREFEAVLSGFRGLQRGDLVGAERGLTKALALPEMAFMREEIFLTRAKVRYLRKAFDAGIEDIKSFLATCSESPGGYYFLGQLQIGRSFALKSEGKDPLGALRDGASAFSEGLRRHGDSVEIMACRALVYQKIAEREMGRGIDSRDTYRKAIQDCTEALRINPDLVAAYMNRAGAYRGLGGLEAEKGSDPREFFRKAVEDCDAALRRKPSHASLLCARALALFSLGEAEVDRGSNPIPHYQDAVRGFSEALRLRPGYGLALNNRGYAYIRLGEIQEGRGFDGRESFRQAIRDYEEALRKYPGYVEAITNRGNAWKGLAMAEAARGRDPTTILKKALADYNEALNRDATHLAALDNRGITYCNLARAEAVSGFDPKATFLRAIKDFDAVLERLPDKVTIYSHRALTYRYLGDDRAKRGLDSTDAYRQAIKDFSEAIRKDPKFYSAYNNRGNVWVSFGTAMASQGKDPREFYRQAISDYDRVLQINPAHWQGRANKGRLLVKMGRFEEAVTAFQEASRIVGGRIPRINQMLEGARNALKLPLWKRSLNRARLEMDYKDLPAAKTWLERAVREAEEAGAYRESGSRPLLGNVHFYLARIYAQASIGKAGPPGKEEKVAEAEAARCRESAISHLKKVMELGGAKRERVLQEPALAPIRELPAFKALLAEWENK
ncbi:MAG: protein kinase domain-containing protein, partial [Planctomycetota bacterium]